MRMSSVSLDAFSVTFDLSRHAMLLPFLTVSAAVALRDDPQNAVNVSSSSLSGACLHDSTPHHFSHVCASCAAVIAAFSLFSRLSSFFFLHFLGCT